MEMLQRILDSRHTEHAITVPPGRYQGPVVINRPVKIHAADVTVVSTEEPVLVVASENVSIRGLHIVAEKQRGHSLGDRTCALDVREHRGLKLRDVKVSGEIRGLKNEEGTWALPEGIEVELLAGIPTDLGVSVLTPVHVWCSTSHPGFKITTPHLTPGTHTLGLHFESMPVGSHVADLNLDTRHVRRVIRVKAEVRPQVQETGSSTGRNTMNSPATPPVLVFDEASVLTATPDTNDPSSRWRILEANAPLTLEKLDEILKDTPDLLIDALQANVLFDFVAANLKSGSFHTQCEILSDKFGDKPNLLLSGLSLLIAPNREVSFGALASLDLTSSLRLKRLLESATAKVEHALTIVHSVYSNELLALVGIAINNNRLLEANDKWRRAIVAFSELKPGLGAGEKSVTRYEAAELVRIVLDDQYRNSVIVVHGAEGPDGNTPERLLFRMLAQGKTAEVTPVPAKSQRRLTEERTNRNRSQHGEGSPKTHRMIVGVRRALIVASCMLFAAIVIQLGVRSGLLGSTTTSDQVTGTPPRGTATPSTVRAQDLFANAVRLTSNSGRFEGDTTGAQNEQGEPRHANVGGASVWFSWSTSSGGPMTFDTFGSGYDTVLAVYTGLRVNQLTRVADNDDAARDTTDSSVQFNARPNVTYYIAVSGYLGSTGRFVFNWRRS
jgi:hypothetical protein